MGIYKMSPLTVLINKKLIGFCFLFIMCSCKDTITEYYPNGNIRFSYEVNSSGELEGEAREYFEQGGISMVMMYENGKPIDSSIHYSPDTKKIFFVMRYLEQDTVFCKILKEDKVIQSGKMLGKNRFGRWDFFNNQGRLYEQKEYIILCNESYFNQAWEFGSDGNILKGIGNNYKVEIESQPPFYVGDSIKFKVSYNPNLGSDSQSFLYSSNKIAKDFCNVDKARENVSESYGNEFFVNATFGKAGKQNIRGFIEEIATKINPGTANQYATRKVYVDIPFVIKSR